MSEIEIYENDGVMGNLSGLSMFLILINMLILILLIVLIIISLNVKTSSEETTKKRCKGKNQD